MQPFPDLIGADGMASKDLGRLAEVFEELRQAIDAASKTVRRFAREAGSDLNPLRLARQQLNQAAEALQSLDMGASTRLLRAMEALTEHFLRQPQACTDEAAAAVERAGFALTDYLERVLKRKSVSSVALFPQYRALQELLGAQRVHPSDLWPFAWRWTDVVLPAAHAPLLRDAAVQARFDQAALRVLKSADAAAALALRDLSLGFAAAQDALQARIFWKVSAACFEAVALGLSAWDVYAKRTVSRILLQDRMLARGEPAMADLLMQDLLFFCAQANPPAQAECLVLVAVRAAYGLTEATAVDYETVQFGHFDPALLLQTGQRLAAAREAWSVLAGGSGAGLTLALEPFGLVGESVLKLQPQSSDLVHVLMLVIDATERSGEPPAPALAREVATAVLHLEALLEDFDSINEQVTQRSAALTRRLDQIHRTGRSEPLEKWMAQLFRSFSEKQVVGSVVDELRRTLAQVEAAARQFFHNPADKMLLQEVPGQLAHMRGIFSVLGLEQAALAALRMRASVEQFLLDEVEVVAARAGAFLRFDSSLEATGFLIDVLSFQRELARKLFAYDDDAGEFRCLMGSETALVSVTPASRAVPTPDEPSKLIGNLRIALPLYNVYLNEADEWSRRLITELSEWALELHRPVFDSTIELAHGLSHASDTVGFHALSELAGALERALRQVQRHAAGSAEQAKLFLETAEVMRRLLHQFAAGFLKSSDQELLSALEAIRYGTTAPARPTAAGPFGFVCEDAPALLAQLGSALRQWTARPDNLGARSEVLRVLQTFKAAAETAGATDLVAMAQNTQTAIEGLGIESLQTPKLEFLLDALDAMQSDVERQRRATLPG